MRYIVLFAASLTSSLFADAVAQEVRSVTKVYYYDWMATSIVPLSRERLREEAFHTLTIENGPLERRLLELLDSIEFSDEMSDPRYMNGRLLVEIDVETERQRTYFANRTRICRLENQVCAKIDVAFRADIHDLVTSTID